MAIAVGVQCGEDERRAAGQPVAQGGQQVVGIDAAEGADAVGRLVELTPAQVSGDVRAEEADTRFVAMSSRGTPVLGRRDVDAAYDTP